MSKQSLPDFAIDRRLNDKIVVAVLEAEKRGTNTITVFGTLAGAAVAEARDAGATLEEVFQTIEIAWNNVATD
jgi:hypothetical protein